MKKAQLVLLVLLALAALRAASCGYLDDTYTNEIIPDDADMSGMNERAQAWVSEDQRRIEITAMGGACDESAEIRVSESAGKVQIVLRVTTNEGICLALGVSRRFPVELREPLGRRALVGSHDRPYPRLKARPEEGSLEYGIRVKVVRDD